MKKTLIALAALATTAAFAQSSVSITGRVDMGLVNTKTTNTNLADVSTSTTVTDLTGNQNGRTTSRLTFSGVEDLGGGMSARFNIETGLNPSDDAALFSGSTRNGSLSLVTGVGAFSIGTFTSNGIDAVRGLSAATFSVGGGDFLANTASGAQFNALLTAIGAPTLPAGVTLGMSGRSRNAVAYSGAFGPVSVSLGLHSQKNVAATTKTSGSIIGLGYVDGPITARLAIGNAKSSNSVTGTLNGKNSDVVVGGSYNLGMAVPYAVYETVKLTVPGGNIKADAFEVGARFPMGALTPYVLVATGNHKADGDKIAKSTGFQLGTTYDLSKRTYLYTAVGQDKVKGVDDGPVGASSKRNSFIAGLVHQF